MRQVSAATCNKEESTAHIPKSTSHTAFVILVLSTQAERTRTPSSTSLSESLPTAPLTQVDELLKLVGRTPLRISIAVNSSEVRTSDNKRN